MASPLHVVAVALQGERGGGEAAAAFAGENTARDNAGRARPPGASQLAMEGGLIVLMVLDASLPRLLLLSTLTMKYVSLRRADGEEDLLIRDGLLITVGI